MQDRNKEWAKNLSLQEVLADEQMSADLRRIVVQNYGKEESLVLFLTELMRVKPKLLKKYVSPLFKELQSDLVHLCREYVAENAETKITSLTEDGGGAGMAAREVALEYLKSTSESGEDGERS